MIDQSYFVPLLPEAGARLNFIRANDIEKNVGFLIRQWPAFETETLAELVGSYGFLQNPERASPAEGAQVTLLQHLPRLLVLLTGPGAETLSWSGDGWEAAQGPGLTLAHMLDPADEKGAMGVLAALSVWCAGDADVTVSLAAEREDGSLRILRENLTRLLFRAGATWGLVEEKTSCWGGLAGMDWEDAEQMRIGVRA